MGTRALQASPKGIEKATIALAQYSLSQNALAKDLGLSRQTVNNFFKGKPIDRENFALICDRLGLDLESTVATVIPKPETSQLINSSELDALVQEVRQKVHANVQKRCGTMRVLDMEQPITLDSIYTKVNILEKVSCNQRRTIAELLDGCDLEDFDRFTLGRVLQERISGLEAVQRHSKLLILGKPGAGKTTFLKWIAIQCNEGQLYTNRVPIFITLKEFAEASGQPSLQSFISSQFTSCGIENAEGITATLVKAGQALVLLDGLDEVRDVDHDRVLQEIRDISTWFDTSQFVITCRIAAREYIFQQFTEVEVADFDDKQITEFSYKWFHEKDPVKAEQFPKELETHQPLKELATNPLLLTLLCLVFEEQTGFPVNRAELYKEGLDVLLKKWDAKRNIKRDEVYKDLSLKRKEELLSQIAFTTFERSEYFFKQKVVEEKIEQYIRNLPHASTDLEVLQLDSEAVLKSIEAQHGLLAERARGIYSFSHLTFHEYFTAHRIEKRDELHPILISHLIEKRWREVILLTVEMVEEADSLLLKMKSQIDQIVAADEKLQQFLIWVNQKSCSVNKIYKPVAIRAFYFARARRCAFEFDLTLEFDRTLALDLDHTLASTSPFVLDPDRDLAIALEIAFASNYNRALDFARGLTVSLDLVSPHDPASDFDRTLALDLILARIIASTIDPTFKQLIQEIKDQLPTSKKDREHFKQWWQTTGLDWTVKLRTLMIKYRNIGYDWQFSDTQKEKLQQYYDANRLLVDCFKSDCYVHRKVREEIEDSLFLPMQAQE